MKADENIFYSEDFNSINKSDLIGWAVHVLCHTGTASFIFHGKPVNFKCGDVVIYSNAELVSDLQGSNDLQVEIIAMRSSYMHTILPSQHFGIGGRVSLYHDPVLSVTKEEFAHLHESIQHLRNRYQQTGHAFQQELINSLVLAITYDLFDCHQQRDRTINISGTAGIVVRKFLELIYAGEVKTHRDLRFYAEKLNVTEHHLADTVRSLTGQKASDIIVIATVPIIAEMLRNTDLTISQIADELHFNSLSYFSRYVQKHLGLSPASFRRTILPIVE